MKIQALEAVAAETQAAYIQVRDLYHRVLLLTGEDSSLIRCQQFFRDNEFQDEALKPKPYGFVAPHTRASFHGEDGFECSFSMGEPAADGHAPVEITLENGEATDWFALEVEIPWREIRGNAKVTSGLFLTSAKATEFRFDVFFWTLGGERLSLFKQQITRSGAESQSSIRFDGDFTLPSNVQIDFKREPVAAFFLDPKIGEIGLVDMYIGFNQ